MQSSVLLDAHLANRGKNYFHVYDPETHFDSGYGLAFILAEEVKISSDNTGAYQKVTSLGLFGILGVTITEDQDGNVTHWFGGIDYQVRGALMVGGTGEVKIGFAQ
ncbi:MAG TPA: hypothetical protein VHA52_01200 [Candidatus Babeliaceae bacterium]|nr:hypothetical protein [Candidatus Babeliaceae bacterium]